MVPARLASPGKPLLRSVLYMPASNTRALQKAPALTSCDAFIFDLEDAVAPAAKAEARRNAVAALKDKRARFGLRQVVLRVNGAGTEWFEEDVRAAQAAQPDAVLLAKAEEESQIVDLASRLGPDVRVWSMIETPRAVLNAGALARSSAVLVMGTVDLQNELECSTDPLLERQPLMSALQHVVLAARAHGQSGG
jgi:citrate lyase beta subunit